MSVQFRTSQKDLISIANASNSTGVGVCCRYNVNNGYSKTTSTPLDCYLTGGYFQYGEASSVDCFHAAELSSNFNVMGCCCSCSVAKESDNYDSYVSGMVPIDQYCNNSSEVPPAALNYFGIRNTTQCECDRIGGKWTAGLCPEAAANNKFNDASQVRQYCYERRSIDPPPPAPSDGSDNEAPCGSAAATGAGGNGVTYRRFNFNEDGYGSGYVTVNYQMHGIPDRMDILYPAPTGGATYSDSTIVASTNDFVAGTGSLVFNYSPFGLPQFPPSGYTATFEEFVIRVIGNPNYATVWNYTVSCPSPSGQESLSDIIPPPGFSCDVDVRLSRSCCYFDYDINGFPLGLSCENVCNARECELKSISSHPSVYSTGTLCYPDVLHSTFSSYTCGNVLSTLAAKSTLFQGLPHGSCYTLINNEDNEYAYECNISAEFFCHDGYWVPFSEENELCSNNPYKPQAPIKSARRVEPETMPEEDFDALHIRIGQFYKGGYFIGIYEPGSPLSPTGSEIFGSEQFSYSSFMTSKASGYGDKYSKWALFAEPLDFDISLFSGDEIDRTNYRLLSNYDGFYNCYGDASSFSGIKSRTTNTIVGRNRKGFVDYYIPSINELMFIAKQQMTHKYLAEKLDMHDTYISSSSHSEFLITQHMSGNPIFTADYTFVNYGRILLARPTSLLSCKFLRKIILT